MLKVQAVGLNVIHSFPVDPTARFEPGMIGQLAQQDNMIVMTVSDGRAPFGIIDDIKAVSLTATQQEEIVVITAQSFSEDGYGGFISDFIESQELENSNLVVDSFFTTSDVGVIVNYRNGTIKIPAGTELNFNDGTVDEGIFNALKIKVSYRYYIPSEFGEDTTLASGKVSIRFDRGIYATDQYDTSTVYSLNDPLFVSAEGKLTTKSSEIGGVGTPVVGTVTCPPTNLSPFLEFFWF